MHDLLLSISLSLRYYTHPIMVLEPFSGGPTYSKPLISRAQLAETCRESSSYGASRPIHKRNTPYLRRGYCCRALPQLWQQYLINAALSFRFNGNGRSKEFIKVSHNCKPRLASRGEEREPGNSCDNSCHLPIVVWCGVSSWSRTVSDVASSGNMLSDSN